MITLYGITRSRAARCMWMLEELGLPYERKLIAPLSQESRSPDYLALNPNARVPTLTDDGTVLFESMAINLYLAERYGKGLWPGRAEDHARCYQWSFWGMMELEALLLTALRHTLLLPEDERDPEELRKVQDGLARPLGALEGVLAAKPYLLGETFTVADLNVASVLNWALRARISLDATPRVKDWLNRCVQRPAQQKVVADMRAASKAAAS
jgi:glutathione S-transferase